MKGFSSKVGYGAPVLRHLKAELAWAIDKRFEI